jgi:ABC-type uncharacterized transport system ATPase subunit
MPEAKTSAPEYSKEEQKWRAEEDLRTLIRAKEIKSDKKRLMAALKCGREQKADLLKVLKEGSDE